MLHVAATLFTLAVLIHNFDHLRRGGDSVTTDVFAIGTAAIVVEVAVVMIVTSRHPAAPLAAAAIGLSLAAGYVMVHFTPDRSWLSDSFVERGAAAVSVMAATLEAVAAVCLGVAGLWVMRRRGGLSAAARTDMKVDSLTAVMRNPLVLAMVAGNLVVLAGTMATR